MGGLPYSWSPELDAELERLFRDGAAVKSIARMIDRPHHAVATRIDRLRELGRLPFRNKAWTPSQDRMLMEGRDAGLSYPKLAGPLGRSPAALRMRRVQLRREADEGDQDQYQMELRAA